MEKEFVFLLILSMFILTFGIVSWIVYYIRFKRIIAIAKISWLINILFFEIFRMLSAFGIILPHVPLEQNHHHFVLWVFFIIIHGGLLSIVSSLAPPRFEMYRKEIKKWTQEGGNRG